MHSVATESQGGEWQRPSHPSSARIDEAFAEVVARFGDSPALTFSGATLTYRQLDQQSDKFAAHLSSRGVRSGDRVGICLDRSFELIVAMLGVLKSGAIYVPMDPSYPAERLAFVANNADLRFIFAETPEFPVAHSVSVITPEEAATGGHKRNPAPQSASAAAYVIYTSGSTGKPKGVVVPHQNVTALIDATRADLGLVERDVWSLFHSSAFDFSVWEVWGALLTGARLVILPYWATRDPDEFWNLLDSEKVTVLNQTPSAFAQLIEADSARDTLLNLRLVIFGGEALNPRMLLRWFERYPERAVRHVNMYGITETTVHVTSQTITRRHALQSSKSVGMAIQGWSVAIRDAGGLPVPVGAAGEIYVGGAGLALMYLGKPELTADRFVMDKSRNERMYRSGDLGRLRSDGSLEHLGRTDSQVKIRGFRIELDEVKTIILADDYVVAAAVVLAGDAQADPAGVHLNAYAVMKGSSPTELRERLSRVLPSFMMPSSITKLDDLPLTPNGKLDSRALPVPTSFEPLEQSQYLIGSRRHSGIAGDMHEVWTATLGVPVDLDDNFFDLGGNSLYAVRVMAGMRQRGLPPLSLRELYLYPTIGQLVQLLTSDANR